MRSELAEELLNSLMGWDRAAFQEKVRRLEALAAYKYDEYANFRPGVKFLESLAAWLGQFESGTERVTALEFVLERVVFISDAEMSHLIELVYEDHIEAVLRRHVAGALEVPEWRVAEIVGSSEYRELRRRSLILGASDGARLDRLRRSAPLLSHEQFLQATEPRSEDVAAMCEKLHTALEAQGLSPAGSFAQIFLVDDFAGSGETMLRVEDGVHKGKLVKLNRAVDRLIKDGLVEEDVGVTVVLYAATEQAINHLSRELEECGMANYEIRVVQSIPASLRVDTTSPDFSALSEKYYDESITDEHKGRAPLGYASCALPLVLSHNTPNNSVSLLWADTTADSALRRRALFPRYERHHRDRP